MAKNETREQIRARIQERFSILNDFTVAAIQGDVNAMIVSGPPGIGKSFGVEKALRAWDPTGFNYTVTKGFAKATGLLKLLYQHRAKNNVIVFDDSDSIFWDDVSLNLLKAVCDSTEDRYVCYLAESNMVDERSGELLPSRFEFQGTIIFLTNLDFDTMIAKGNKVAPHLEALMSRAHYIDLAMKNKLDFIVRIEQIVSEGEILKHLPVSQRVEVVKFIEDNQDSLREISLRMVVKIGDVRRMMNWQAKAKVTCCKAV